MRDPNLEARAILASSRFRPRPQAPKAHPSAIERVLQWLGDRWHDVLQNLFGHVHVSAGTTSVAGELLLGALFVLLAVVIVRLFLNLSREAPAAAEVTELRDAVPARNLYELSIERARAGAFDAALALLYRAALALLAERSILRERSSATAGEVERALRRIDRGAAAAFSPIARQFSAVAYADRHANADAWAQARSAYERLAEDPR